jgi:hypothetical protein
MNLFNLTGKTTAYVLISGELGFTNKENAKLPGLPIARGEGKKWRDGIRVHCRLAYDGKRYFVPGVPEARSIKEACDAVIAFVNRLKDIDARRANHA